MAAVYYVGSCNAGGYGTIQAAVDAVPAGSTIDVCPGTYPEQVTISKALTLQGITYSNSSQAIITMPSAGLTTTSDVYWGVISAQVEVTSGPVNITNVTVDGTAGTSDCPFNSYTGIFYANGSSGTVNEVETRGQNCAFSGSGFGIMAENGAGTVQVVKIENSNIHDYSYIGVFTAAASPSTLTATISGNYVYGGGSKDYAGIDAYTNTAGVVSGNIISGSTRGVLVYSGTVTVSGNTVTDGSYGIDLQAAASVTSNRVFNTPTGIFVGVNGATIKSNTIAKAATGIQINCWTATVTGNTVNGATNGLDYVPSAFAGANKFYNVATVRNKENCN
jgi:hypothetical protein